MQNEEDQIAELILDAIEQLLKERKQPSLSESDRLLLRGFLQHPELDYEDLAEEFKQQRQASYHPRTLKTRGYELCKRLTQLLGDELGTSKLGKKNCLPVLSRWYMNKQKSASRPSPTEIHQSDIARLTEQIKQGCRVVCISGLPGIGKTELARALYRQLFETFEHRVWCIAARVKSLEALYREVVGSVARATGTEAFAQQSDSLIDLRNLLRNRPTLLVIDQTEALYQAKCLAGRFCEEASQYEQWLKIILEDPDNRSCLLWVGEEVPDCLKASASGLYRHSVSGLQLEDACLLLREQIQGITELGESFQRLFQRIGGHPRLLLDAAGKASSSSINILLNPSSSFEKLLKRLEDREEAVLQELLLNPGAQLDVLKWNIAQVLIDEIPDVIDSLERRELVQQDSQGHYRFKLPVLKEVFGRRLIDRLAKEIEDGHFEVLSPYPLLNLQADIEHQTWHKEHLIERLKKKLQTKHRSRTAQLQLVQAALAALKAADDLEDDFGPGNWINLAVAMSLPLAELDWSGLTIRHADLSQVDLSRVNTEGCHFIDCYMPDGLVSPLVSDFSADADVVAVGDDTGKVICWCRQGSVWQFFRFYKLSHAIHKLEFSRDGLLVVATAVAVYLWQLEVEDSSPELIMNLPQPVCCLESGQHAIAAGLVDGHILLWSPGEQEPLSIPTYRSRVLWLAFSADSRYLASIGDGNQVLIWDLPLEPMHLRPLDRFNGDSRLILNAVWKQDELLIAQAAGDQIRLLPLKVPGEEGPPQGLTMTEGVPAYLCFSKDGCRLATISDTGSIDYWNLDEQQVSNLPISQRRPEKLRLSNDGKWLLTISQQDGKTTQLELWNVHTLQRAWYIERQGTEQLLCQGMNLNAVQGLKKDVKTLLKALGAQE